MRELHVVALSEDGQYVLLAPSRGATRGGFRVALDSRLAAAVRGDLPRPGGSAPPASLLTPKDIQARLRAGESPEQIAASAGVPVSRVDRFSGPVLSEREKIIERARAAVLTRGRRGDSAVSLAEAVDQHLAQAGTARDATDWSARRLQDGVWLVEMTCATRGRPRHGAWRYDPASRILTAADPTSAALGFVEPPARQSRAREAGAVTGSRRGRSSAVAAGRTIVAMPPSKPRRTPPAAAAAATVGRQTARSAALTSAAKAPAAAKAPVAKARTAKAATAKAPAAKAAAKVPAAKAPPAAPPAATTPPAGSLPGGPPQLRVVPPHAEPAPAPDPAADADQQPPTPAQPPTPSQPPTPAKPLATAARRAAVPGWADVLLSTAPVRSRPDDSPQDRQD